MFTCQYILVMFLSVVLVAHVYALMHLVSADFNIYTHYLYVYLWRVLCRSFAASSAPVTRFRVQQHHHDRRRRRMRIICISVLLLNCALFFVFTGLNALCVQNLRYPSFSTRCWPGIILQCRQRNTAPRVVCRARASGVFACAPAACVLWLAGGGGGRLVAAGFLA